MELKLETYVHPSLKEVVPVEIRKQVYRKAIYLVENDGIFGLEDGNSLCLFLPCILLDLSHYLDLDDDWELSIIAFPELKDKVCFIQEHPDFYTTKCNKFRKQILIEMLNELENK